MLFANLYLVFRDGHHICRTAVLTYGWLTDRRVASKKSELVGGDVVCLSNNGSQGTIIYSRGGVNSSTKTASQRRCNNNASQHHFSLHVFVHPARCSVHELTWDFCLREGNKCKNNANIRAPSESGSLVKRSDSNTPPAPIVGWLSYQIIRLKTPLQARLEQTPRSAFSRTRLILHHLAHFI